MSIQEKRSLETALAHLENSGWKKSETGRKDAHTLMEWRVKENLEDYGSDIVDEITDTLKEGNRVKTRSVLFPQNSEGYVTRHRRRGDITLKVMGENAHEEPSFFLINPEGSIAFTDVCLCFKDFPVAILVVFEDQTEMEDGFTAFQSRLNHMPGILRGVQLYIFTCGEETVIFSNENHKRTEVCVRWADSTGRQMLFFEDFCKSFLCPQNLFDYLSNSILTVKRDENDVELIPLKAHQHWACCEIMVRLENFQNSGRDDSMPCGHIAHATGSGKTYTMFAAALRAMRMKLVDKVLIVLDRKELLHQTHKVKEQITSSFSHSNKKRTLEGFIKDVQHHQNPSLDIEVTMIRTLSNLSKDSSAEIGPRTMILFDEGHRSQSGESHKTLRKQTRSPFFAFTGTPLHAESAATARPGAKTTHELFGECIHTYLISQAMADGNVLRIRGYYENVTANDSVMADIDDAAQKTQETIASWVCEHHNFFTKDRMFSAILTTSGIPKAGLLYKAIKAKSEELNLGLKIAVSVSTNRHTKSNVLKAEGPKIVDDDEVDVDDDEETDEEGAAIAPSALELMEEAAKDYKDMAGLSSIKTLRKDSFSGYRKEIAKSVNMPGGIDLLIVVGQFITGFDAARVNTVYVARKTLQEHNIIQVIARTNRLGSAEKDVGNAVFLYDMENEANAAIRIYSDGNMNELNGIFRSRHYSECLRDLESHMKIFDEAYKTHMDKAFHCDESVLMQIRTLGRAADRVLQETMAHLDYQPAELNYDIEAFSEKRKVIRRLLEEMRDEEGIRKPVAGDMIQNLGSSMLQAKDVGLYSDNDIKNMIARFDPKQPDNAGKNKTALLMRALLCVRKELPPEVRDKTFQDILTMFLASHQVSIVMRMKDWIGNRTSDVNAFCHLTILTLQRDAPPSYEDFAYHGITEDAGHDVACLQVEIEEAAGMFYEEWFENSRLAEKYI